MQKRLAQIAQIPLMIQSTLDSVTKTFEEFLPTTEEHLANEDESIVDTHTGDKNLSEIASILEHQQDRNDDDDIGKIDVDDDDHDVTVTNVNANDELETIMANIEDVQNEFPITFSPEPTPEPELTEEQIIRLEKQIKVRVMYSRNKCNFSQFFLQMKELERSWPWGDQEKRIYK